MPTFLHPALLAGLALVAVPVLIHLINLLRHRRMPWAAMEFLLASQRKNSSWVRFKELLLLAMRMAVVAAVVCLVAQPMACSQLGRFVAGRKTHHIVLLDDSYSMSDRWSDTSAFNEARDVLAKIGDELAGEPHAQSFTLLRFSRAGRGTPDLLAEKVDTTFGARLGGLLKTLRPSQSAAGPAKAVQEIELALGDAKDEDRVIYLVSDFRANEWDEPGELTDALARLDRSRAQVRLIDCVDQVHDNLAISALQPGRGTRAAGVPLFCDVTVANYGGDRVDGVTVLLQEDARARPALSIDTIAPGESETRSFPVYFSTAGQHVVAASLPADGVAADNVRFLVVELPTSVPVLLIDGGLDTTDARYLATALAPGGAVKTGIDPRIEPPNFLNSHPLDKFQAVYLLNVDRLDQPAIDALESYVRAGGGLGVFLGDACRARFYNEKLYRDGQGPFPLPLVAKTQLLVNRLERTADFEVADHPIFRVFSGERNNSLNAVTIDWYFSAPKRWAPEPNSTTRILARLRNGAPLAVQREFGEGHVVAILTTAAPTWNNWGLNPSFVVAALEMQSYLAAQSPPQADNRAVGSPIELDLDPGRYQPQVRLISPLDGDGGGDTGTLVNNAAPQPGSTALRATFPETEAAGVYTVELTTTENQVEGRRLAFNVEPAEGNLARVSPAELAARLKGVHYDYLAAREFRVTKREHADSPLTDVILYLLVGLFVGEQLLAYSASYHPAREAIA